MNKSVIIAESSPLVGRSIADAFEEHGYLVAGIFTDGLSAMRAAKANPPTIVTLDLILPRLSGLQLAGALGKLANPPLIIAISAVTARSRLAQAKVAGIRYYLLKPLVNDKLREVLSRQLGVSSSAATG
ncbi:MAG: response regulator [Myxococcales bacterium]|nr:response regulator [Myxococcales bacterium]